MIQERIEVSIAGGLEVPLPRMVKVRQKFNLPSDDSVATAVAREMKRPEVRSQIRPGMTIAVGCGSRGIAHIAECARAVVSGLQALGAKPFVFPAMGSHGGATAEGQRQVLETFGITEEYIGCDIRSSMESVELGHSKEGIPVHVDRHAAAADGIVLLARIKPHTSFRGSIESGLVKMLTVGMGKIAGATELHRYGMNTFGDLLPKAASFILAKLNVPFGLAIVENAAGEIARIEAVPGQRILQREPELLVEAKEIMARLQFDEFDVLVVDQIGKDISGSGMDPNVTGRNQRFVEWDMKPRINKIVTLGLTAATHGNACGVSIADIITTRLFNRIDFAQTYANVITTGYLDGAMIPLMMNTDREAIMLAVKTAGRVEPSDCRIVRISNTLELVNIEVSEPLIDVVRADPSRFEITGSPEPWRFDASGMLAGSEH